MESLIRHFLDATLVDAVACSYQLESLYVGKHIIRDTRSWRTGDVTVEGFWIVEVQPFGMEPSCLAVLTINQQQHALFAVRQGRAQVQTSSISLVTTDPVVDLLHRFDMCEVDDGRITLDGITYKFARCTYAMSFAMQFSNPHTLQLMTLAKAMLQLARASLSGEVDDSLQDYVEKWASYTTVGSG